MILQRLEAHYVNCKPGGKIAGILAMESVFGNSVRTNRRNFPDSSASEMKEIQILIWDDISKDKAEQIGVKNDMSEGRQQSRLEGRMICLRAESRADWSEE
ncbi:hypothetical protein PoB_006896800 [Plakobranchus ocellatus]|uniref:Uncharacterized protein n=1 Tax=Plakobranchus ocellatus TaxID=259542 RepID=A0AAV4DE04_9GAST|nr:hypothetical protein PoB_006896800 [Plakobranchus ocellatus]